MKSPKVFPALLGVFMSALCLLPPSAESGSRSNDAAIAAAIPAETVTVHADAKLGAPRRFTGFLHGITNDSAQDYTTTIDLLSTLNPALWRLSNHANNVYGFVVTRAQFPQDYGTLITVVLQDAFNNQYGDPIVVGNCNTARSNCFATFADLRTAWKSFVDGFVQTVSSYNLAVHYYDVFAEPDSGWLGVSQIQLFELFKAAHDVVRQRQPQAKIVGPSIAAYDRGYVERFLAYVAANNLRLDALSWHEFRAPDSLPAHTYEMQQYLSANPSLCNPACPEIHINEYAGSGTHLIAGWTVGWLHYLEEAGVDQAHRACWDVSGGWSTCWAGFDGVLLQDNVTTQHIYWVYKWHADTLASTRLSVDTTSSGVVALARLNDPAKEISVLAGRYDGGTGSVALAIKNYPYRNKLAKVTVDRIPTNANIPSALSAPAPVSSSEIEIAKDGTVNITLDSFQDGEAYLVSVKPGIR